VSKSRNDSNRQRSFGHDGQRHKPQQQPKRPMNDHQLTRRVHEMFNDGELIMDKVQR